MVDRVQDIEAFGTTFQEKIRFPRGGRKMEIRPG